MFSCLSRWRALLLCVLLSAAFADRSTAAPARTTAKRPNILFLIADEMRADCLGIAGHPMVKTPNLDKLAREGVRFTRAYAAAPVCSPDRATLFTGRYSHSHGVVMNDLPFNPGEVVLPALLRRHEYVTGISGKLHLRKRPDWFDYERITAGGSGKEYREFLRKEKPRFKGRSNTAAIPETLIGRPRTPLRIGTSVLPERLYEEAWVADRAIDFLRSRSSDGKPWFLFVSMLKPHSAFVIPEPYATMYKPEDVLLPKTFQPGIPRPAAMGNARHFISDPEILRAVSSHYYGSVTLVDRHMGRVMAELDRLGMDENTIVLFTADHGNMLGERNRMFKGVMYESSVRVPQILRFPGRLKAGMVSDVVHDHTDIMPTLLDLAGVEIPGGVQGESLVPILRGRESAGRKAAFSLFKDGMVVQGDWKLIDPSRSVMRRAQLASPPELYNLAKDPDEQNNLHGQPNVADAQRRLEKAIETWWNRRPTSSPTGR